MKTIVRIFVLVFFVLVYNIAHGQDGKKPIKLNTGDFRMGQIISKPIRFVGPTVKDGVSSEVKRGNTQNNSTSRVLEKDKDDPQKQMFCTTKEISLDESPQEEIGFLITSGNASDIYPGAIFKADAFISGSGAQPNLRHKAYHISANGLTSAESGETFREIVTPDSEGYIYKADVSKVMSNMMRSHRNVGNAGNFVYTVTKIDHEKDLALMAAGAYSGFGVDIKAKFDYSNKQKNNLYVARFYQRYYSFLVDQRSIVDEEDRAKIKTDDVYISEVTYGRVGFIRIESDYDEEVISAALDASYKGGGSYVEIGASLNLRDVKKEWKFTAFATGGAPKTFDTQESFNTWIEDAKWNPSIAQSPIGYKLKFLNNNQIADVRVTTKYTKRECRPYYGTKVSFIGMEIAEGFHNGDCTRIAHMIQVSAHKVDGAGNIVATYEGIPDNFPKSDKPILSRWNKQERSNETRCNGKNGNCAVWVPRQQELITNGLITNSKGRHGHVGVNLSGTNAYKSTPQSVEFKIDQAALNENRIILKFHHYINTCHKFGSMAGDFNCNLETLGKTFVVKKKLKSELWDIEPSKKAVVFSSGNIPGDDKWNHKWKVYYKVER